MLKAYNLSELFKEDEFDVQKGYNRFGAKEDYFAALYEFTRDSEIILKKCEPDRYKSWNVDIKTLTRYVERLQKSLAGLGAIKLAWNIQSLNHLLEERRYGEYSRGFARILADVDKLRQRVVDAEKMESVPEYGSVQTKQDRRDEGKKAGEERRHIKLRRGDFEKLVMLIDNFELESAVETADLIMQYSYTPEIDKALEDIYETLNQFNFSEALEKAQRLLNLVIRVEESENPVKKSILAIDDMPDVLRTVKAMLRDKYNVFGMTNYDSAIKFLRSNTADLIMLDIEMPGLDGFAMMQLFRKLPDCADTPIVFLTSNVSQEHVKMAMDLGAKAFIRKPVDVAVLIAKLEEALSHRYG